MKLADYLNISYKMKNIRKNSGISQKDMANKLGISNSAYSNYENGYSEPSAEILNHFCKILNISISDLLEAQIQTTPQLKTYADLFSIFFQLEEMQIPVSYDFYSEPETISGKTKLKSKIVINMENPQIATFISAWNAKQNEKDLLNKSVDKTNDTELFKSNIEKDYQQWKERMLSLFNIPIN